ncbi:MAG: glycosyl hydrolase [Candidatus Omnitrophota bacterium]|jgi:beta-mannanase
MRLIILAFVVFLLISAGACARGPGEGCFTGAFLADKPDKEAIMNFERRYAKKPYLVMVFVDWKNFPGQEAIAAIYERGSVLFLTWEPWDAVTKKAIDYDGLLSGKYDAYITEFAGRMAAIGKTVFLRFGHEPNGNWYPWSGQKIGADKFVGMYRRVKDIFNKNNCTNVKWVFCVNWEDVPEENNYFLRYYPGPDYADYVGIDGYNWGNTRSWSRWMSFREIFAKRYSEVLPLGKPVFISEFSSASSGGDKKLWIKEAMRDIKKMKKVRGFLLFNLDKEADWSFPADKESGRELKKALQDPYFLQNGAY